MTNHPYMSLLKLPLLVDFQRDVGQLVLSIISCPSFIIKKKRLKNVVMVTLNTGIMFYSIQEYRRAIVCFRR
jgi:hypothetical protein